GSFGRWETKSIARSIHGAGAGFRSHCRSRSFSASPPSSAPKTRSTLSADGVPGFGRGGTAISSAEVRTQVFHSAAGAPASAALAVVSPSEQPLAATSAAAIASATRPNLSPLLLTGGEVTVAPWR